MAAVCGAALFATAGTASAALINCHGSVTPKSKKKPTEDAQYAFSCDQDIRSYSIVSTKLLDFFGTETLVQPTTSQSATLQCEGTAPGNGFGCGIVNRNTPANCTPLNATPKTVCTQIVSANNTVSGDISFDVSPCGEKPKPKLWLVAGSEPIITNVSPPPAGSPSGTPDVTTQTVGEDTSEPLSLKLKGYGKCKASKSSGKSKGGK